MLFRSAEDTRRTRTLLSHYDVVPRDLRSFHKHNEAARTEEVCRMLAAGGSVALVSDSGTPLVSDPGLRLVRAALDVGARAVPIPGASAVLAALVACGLEPEPFTFLGFLPRTGRRQVVVDLLRREWLRFEDQDRVTIHAVMNFVRLCLGQPAGEVDASHLCADVPSQRMKCESHVVLLPSRRLRQE